MLPNCRPAIGIIFNYHLFIMTIYTFVIVNNGKHGSIFQKYIHFNYSHSLSSSGSEYSYGMVTIKVR